MKSTNLNQHSKNINFMSAKIKQQEKNKQMKMMMMIGGAAAVRKNNFNILICIQ